MNEPAPRRMMRSSDRRLGGVCAGIADYFALDPTLVRVVAVLLLLVGPLGGLTFLGYIVLWIVLPESPEPAGRGAAAPRRQTDMGFILGLALLAAGAWLLIGRIGWMGMGWMHGWGPGFGSGFGGGPLLIILIGLIVVMVSRRRKS